MLNKKSVDDINVKGKRVLVRCDFNVPLQDGKITDENRLVAALPTIKKLVADGGKIILCSHLGKPKGEPKPELSLAPVAKRLTELLGQEVKFVPSPVVVDDTVKAVSIDGAEATVENIKNGTYTIARPFNIATKGEVSDIAQDFINYIMSAEGQAVITENGYIGSDDAAAFKSNGATGKVTVSGSSSVTPVMEKLKEAYTAVNSGAEIEIQESDSTTGMTDAAAGTSDIGMASRELKDSETEQGLTATTIAMDGIAVVVNLDNPTANLTSDQVKGA